MDLNHGPTRFHNNNHRNHHHHHHHNNNNNNHNRFLGAYRNALPLLSSSSLPSDFDHELTEDDIVFTPNFSPPPSNQHRNNNSIQTPPSSTSSSPTSSTNTPRNHVKTAFPENQGILAVLPEISGTNSHFYHKTSTAATSAASTSSSSSARLIPSIPKLPSLTSASLGHYHHQSAPVNVPVLAQRMRKHCEFDEVDLDGDDDRNREEMLPPHEIVARSHTQRAVACSVLEGVGRTLKGRDLRQVRNAIWRQTAITDFGKIHYRQYYI